MRIIKVLHKRVIGKEEKTLPSYYIETENGNRVMIRPVFANDWAKLDLVAVFVPKESTK